MASIYLNSQLYAKKQDKINMNLVLILIVQILQKYRCSKICKNEQEYDVKKLPKKQKFNVSLIFGNKQKVKF